jgi:uncharacterized Zn-binding protein involved in type VI secretion
MPAARVGDMHTCPMLNPGTPPPPHVGGPITMGANTVLICGAPAARVGSLCTCSGPPDSVAMGCTTVLIGDSGAGGGGGSGGSAGQGESAAVEAEESHYLDVKFVDKEGKPISGITYDMSTPSNEQVSGAVTGKIKKSGLEQGNYEIALKAITKSEWSAKSVGVGEKVNLKVETSGIDSGTPAAFKIWEKNINKADRMIASIEDKKIKDDKIEAEWQYQENEEEADEKSGGEKSYSSPKYYFSIEAAGVQGRSGLLEIKDYIEIELKDINDKPIADEDYVLTLPNGDIRKGKLDGSGYKREENIPPGRCLIRFPNLQEVERN